MENFCRVFHCRSVHDVVRNCVHELVSVFFFCGEEEEEVQIMEELVVFVRDTMNMFVAESQGR